jgi:hypothetical protein
MTIQKMTTYQFEGNSPAEFRDALVAEIQERLREIPERVRGERAGQRRAYTNILLVLEAIQFSETKREPDER